MVAKVDIDLEELTRRIAEGHSLSGVATALGFNPQTLTNRLKSDKEVETAFQRGKTLRRLYRITKADHGSNEKSPTALVVEAVMRGVDTRGKLTKELSLTGPQLERELYDLVNEIRILSAKEDALGTEHLSLRDEFQAALAPAQPAPAPAAVEASPDTTDNGEASEPEDITVTEPPLATKARRKSAKESAAKKTGARAVKASSKKAATKRQRTKRAATATPETASPSPATTENSSPPPCTGCAAIYRHGPPSGAHRTRLSTVLARAEPAGRAGLFIA